MAPPAAPAPDLMTTMQPNGSPHAADVQPPRAATDRANVQLRGPLPHRLPLGCGQWSIWRLAGLRGAGFPVEQTLKLAAPTCVTAADDALAAETEVTTAADRLRTALTDTVHALRRDGLWDDKRKRN